MNIKFFDIKYNKLYKNKLLKVHLKNGEEFFCKFYKIGTDFCYCNDKNQVCFIPLYELESIDILGEIV